MLENNPSNNPSPAEASLSELAPRAIRQPGVTMAYRENAVYRRAAAEIGRLLGAEGYALREVVFPAQAGEEEIGRALAGQAQAWRDGVLITDETCRRAFPINARLSEELKLKITALSLDGCCAAAGSDLLDRRLGLYDLEGDSCDMFCRGSEFARHPEAFQEALRSFGRGVTGMYRLALERELPARIDILAMHLLDHPPFKMYAGALAAFTRGEARPGAHLDPQNNWLLNDTALERARKAGHADFKQPHEHIADWLAEAGFPREKVRSITVLAGLGAADFPEEPVWVVADRHLTWGMKEDRYAAGKVQELARLGASRPDELRTALAAPQTRHVRMPIENLIDDLIPHLINPAELFSVEELNRAFYAKVVECVKEAAADEMRRLLGGGT